MAESMNVDPELLAASGHVLDGHSATVHAVYTDADRTIESALFSWAGASRAALAAKAADWTGVTTTLTARLYGHAEGLRVSGLNFAAADRRDAGTLTDLARPGSGE